MGNMSYCRFENTVSDLDDCQMALEDLFQGDSKPLSRTEFNKAIELIQTCADIMMLVQEHSCYNSEDFVDMMDKDSKKVITDTLSQAQDAAGEQE